MKIFLVRAVGETVIYRDYDYRYIRVAVSFQSNDMHLCLLLKSLYNGSLYAGA